MYILYTYIHIYIYTSIQHIYIFIYIYIYTRKHLRKKTLIVRSRKGRGRRFQRNGSSAEAESTYQSSAEAETVVAEAARKTARKTSRIRRELYRGVFATAQLKLPEPPSHSFVCWATGLCFLKTRQLLVAIRCSPLRSESSTWGWPCFQTTSCYLWPLCVRRPMQPVTWD